MSILELIRDEILASVRQRILANNQRTVFDCVVNHGGWCGVKVESEAVSKSQPMVVVMVDLCVPGFATVVTGYGGGNGVRFHLSDPSFIEKLVSRVERDVLDFNELVKSLIKN